MSRASTKALRLRIGELEKQVARLSAENAALRGLTPGVPVSLDASIGGQRVPIFAHGRRPTFWSDAGVREFVSQQHRRMTIHEVIDACRERFGVARTPSRSAIHRYWMKLDDLARGAA